MNQWEPDPQQPGESRLIWQQMRVGCVYWQEAGVWRKEAVWSREGAEEFCASLFRAARRSGYQEAEERVFVADGGDWCWQIQKRYFADATEIVDGYHVSEHVWACEKVLSPESPGEWAGAALELWRERGGWGLRQWLQVQRGELRRGERKAVDALLSYVHPREGRREYPKYRARD